MTELDQAVDDVTKQIELVSPKVQICCLLWDMSAWHLNQLLILYSKVCRWVLEVYLIQLRVYSGCSGCWKVQKVGGEGSPGPWVLFSYIRSMYPCYVTILNFLSVPSKVSNMNLDSSKAYVSGQVCVSCPPFTSSCLAHRPFGGCNVTCACGHENVDAFGRSRRFECPQKVAYDPSDSFLSLCCILAVDPWCISLFLLAVQYTIVSCQVKKAWKHS